MTAEQWERCLTRLAEHLMQQRSAVRRGDLLDVQPFAPAPDLGPLPPSLAGRARELQAQCAALEVELQESQRRTQQALDAVGRGSGPAFPSYVDSRA